MGNRHFKLTPEKKAELKQKRLDKKAKLTLAYQLGYYIGEQIVDKYLLTLSCETIRTNNVIQVSISEADKLRELSDIWFNKCHSIKGSDEEQEVSSEVEWKALRAYNKMLEDKYLPYTIKCHFQVLNVLESDMNDFKKGISTSLWDCDCSHYSCELEDISVEDDESCFFTIQS